MHVYVRSEKCQVAAMPAIQWFIVTPSVERFTLRILLQASAPLSVKT